MQTLNVGAGRTDEEYKAAEDQRRTDLAAEARSSAHYFFVAALLAAIGTGLFWLRLPIIVTIGTIDLLNIYGHAWVQLHPVLERGAAAAWVTILVGLGFAGQKGQRWAFLAGVVLYGADMLALAVTFSWIAMGVHGFFIFKWFQGQHALQEINSAGETRAAQSA